MSVKSTTETQPPTLFFDDGYMGRVKMTIDPGAKVRDVFANFDKAILAAHPNAPRHHLQMSLSSDPEKRCISTQNMERVFVHKELLQPVSTLSDGEAQKFLSLPAATFTRDGLGVITWIPYRILPPRENDIVGSKTPTTESSFPLSEWS